MYNRLNLCFTVLLILSLEVCFLFSCKQKSERSGIETNTNKQVKHKPKSNYSDSLEITGPTAVFYYPDSIQLKTIQSITDPQILDGTLHELQFQIKYSKKVIRSNWRELNIVDAQNVRFLVFKHDTGIQNIIDLDAYDDPYGLIVFNGNKHPVWIDMTNLEQGLHYYLKVK